MLTVIVVVYFILSLIVFVGVLWRSGMEQSARLKKEREHQANSSKDSPEH